MSQSIYTRLRESLTRFFENEVFRRLVKNSGYLVSTTSVSAALSMLQGILVARLLGVEGFGVLGAIIQFTSVINKLISFRMGELVIKYVGHYTESGDRQRSAAVFKLAILVETSASILAFLLVLLLSPYAARFLAKDPNASGLFAVYGLVIIVNLIYESATGLLQISDRFRRIAFFNLAQSIFTLSLITLTFFMGGNLLGILIAYLVGKAVGALGLSVSALVEAARKWGRSWWRAPITLLRGQFKELAHFAVSTNISATISLVTKDSEVLWVSFFRSPLEAGYYRLALSLANIVQMPVSPMPQATYPEISRQAARQQWVNIRYILRQGSRLAGGYSLAATLFIVAFGPFLIQWVYGVEYLPAYPALLILLAGYLVANTFYWRRIALLALGQPDYPAKVNFVLATLKIIGIVMLVPKYGYLASAALLTGFYWAGSLVTVLRIRSLLSERT